MAKTHEIDEAAWAEWIKSRPPVIQAMCEKLWPNRLYRLKTTNQRVTLYSYSENGTVTVNITGEYNLTDFDTHVFGINPEDLEECDLPTEELLGTMLVQEADVESYVDEIRPAILAARGITSCPTHGDTPNKDCKVCSAVKKP